MKRNGKQFCAISLKRHGHGVQSGWLGAGAVGQSDTHMVVWYGQVLAAGPPTTIENRCPRTLGIPSSATDDKWNCCWQSAAFKEHTFARILHLYIAFGQLSNFAICRFMTVFKAIFYECKFGISWSFAAGIYTYFVAASGPHLIAQVLWLSSIGAESI